MEKQAKKRWFLLVGPSGSGKTTIGQSLKAWGVKEVVSYTTRSPRPLEAHGVDYYFVPKEKFEQLTFLETSTYAGNQYGIALEEVERCWGQADDLFSIVDQNGYEKIKEVFPFAEGIFLSVPQSVLISRMKQRGESMTTISDRMAHACDKHEFTPPASCSLVVENKDLVTTLEKIYAYMYDSVALMS